MVPALRHVALTARAQSGGRHQDREDSALSVRLPLIDRPGEALVIWTTTPWTLPANVAAAVRPDIEYGRLPSGDWVSVHSRRTPISTRARPAASSVGLAYEGPFDTLGPGAGVQHRVIPWDEVELETGTGIVHIAPGAGPEDFELATVHNLQVLAPVDEAGRFYPEYGGLAGQSVDEARQPIIDDLSERGLLVEAGTVVHAYPHCWRCDTPLFYYPRHPLGTSARRRARTRGRGQPRVAWVPTEIGARPLRQVAREQRRLGALAAIATGARRFRSGSASVRQDRRIGSVAELKERVGRCRRDARPASPLHRRRS